MQLWTVVLFDVLLDARDELDDDEYQAFVFVVTERIEIEAARLAVGEAVRAKRYAA